LRDVSFELAQGQSLGLIGKNGAGKSTLLKLLANVTLPTSGRIDVSGRMSALLELGTGFHGDLTGRENIYLNGVILGLKRNEVNHRFDEIVAFSEIERFIDTPVKRYSSGMLVRLGFAVAACIEPEILLVDEVLAVGDASFRQKCLHRIQSLIDNGTSIIFVSHNLSMVQTVCPTSLYLVNGQIKRRGETKDIVDVYERDLLEERAQKFEESSPRQSDIVTEVQITHIEMLAMDGSVPEEFSNNQSAEIRIHYVADHFAGAANAVVRITRTDGLTCCMLRTEFDHVELSLYEGGGVISVTVDPLQLVTGTYVIEAFILDGTASLLLASKMSKWVFVSGSARGNEYFGVFEPRRSWAHRSLREAAVAIEPNRDG
jgi:lipopolysaccharide transport system ATP-binding protein